MSVAHMVKQHYIDTLVSCVHMVCVCCVLGREENFFNGES